MLLIIPVRAQSIYEEVPDGQDPFPSWSIDGTLIFAGDHYNTQGNQTQSSYGSRGYFGYTDYNVFGLYQKSPYERLEFNSFGAANFSTYRHPTINGLLVEHARLLWEKGDASIPFRAEAGDFFGDFSLRTMQLGLKGAQLELQPDLGLNGAQTSLLFIAGQPATNYNQVNLGENLFVGASALVSTKKLDWSVNTVFNTQEPTTPATARSQQVVSSIALEKRMSAGTHRLTFEGEGATLWNVSTAGKETSDFGTYAHLSGYSRRSPLTYGFTFEQYGADFLPAGGSVRSNARSYRARASYRTSRNIATRMRLERYEDGYESRNPVITHTAGAITFGAFDALIGKDQKVNANLNTLVTNRRSRDRLQHTTTSSARLSLSQAFTASLDGTADAGYLRTWDHTNKTESQTVDARLGVAKTLDIGESYARLGTSVGSTFNESPTASYYTLTPQLNFDLDFGGHSLSATYGFSHQNSRGTIATTRNWVHTGSLYYDYTYKNHTFNLEASYNNRRTTGSGTTGDYHIGARYTLRFSLPRKDTDPTAEGLPEGTVFTGVQDEQITLADLIPGADFADILALLEESGLINPARLGAFHVYDVDWLPTIATRQQLAIEKTGDGRLSRAALLISLPEESTGRDIRLFYDQALDIFSNNYGGPETYEQGEFTDGFADDIRREVLIRAAQWRLEGGIMRLGIPKRLDRRIQIEVHFARGLPDIRDPKWALDRVR